MEEEIEHEMADKLEGSIAMKARPINNSVSKWAEGATSKVKSIIEWIKIKTEGKNNRAALERLEKRYIISPKAYGHSYCLAPTSHRHRGR